MRPDQELIPNLVSIIVPTYNRAHLIGHALDSIRAQDFTNYEIIVVDDGSTDNTSDSVAKGDVTYIRQKNAGPSAARNNGLKHARGEFIAFLDSDDLWTPHFLSTCLHGFSSHDIAFVFANWQGIFEDGSLNYPDYFKKRGILQHFTSAQKKGWLTLNSEQARDLFIATSTALPSGTVIRRKAISSEWDERLRVGEDRLFFLDIIVDSNCGIAFTTDILWSHRLHSSNSYMGNPDIGKMAEREIQSKEVLLKKHHAFLSKETTKGLQHSIGKNFFDWAYHESQAGHRARALQLYRRAFRCDPNLKTAFAMLKALIKPGKRAESK